VALQAEGVTVSTDALGELSVDLAEYGWFPNSLPSEDADEEQDWEDSEDEAE
jgi:methylated-DNA-protein-cysteine methyltransferase-like protein